MMSRMEPWKMDEYLVRNDQRSSENPANWSVNTSDEDEERRKDKKASKRRDLIYSRDIIMDFLIKKAYPFPLAKRILLIISR